MIQEKNFYIEFAFQLFICVALFCFYYKLKREERKNETPHPPMYVINKRKMINSILFLLITIFILLIANMIAIVIFSDYMLAGIFESIKNICILPLLIVIIFHIQIEA